MNEFGHIADDLTSLEMRVERLLGHAHAKALKAELQRAFVEACKASRAQRLEDEGRSPSPSAQGNGTQNDRKPDSRRATSLKKKSKFELRSAEVSA